MFLLVLPISIGALMLGARRIQNVTTPRHAPLDGISVILSAVAFGGIVYGLSHIGAAAATGNASSRNFQRGRRGVPGGVYLPADLASGKRQSTARPADLRVA